MKRRFPTVSQGAIVLAAISVPPLTAQANRHRPSPAHPGSPHAAPNAFPITSAASRRFTSTNAGSRARDTAQGPHRTLGTKILRQMPASRTYRR